MQMIDDGVNKILTRRFRHILDMPDDQMIIQIVQECLRADLAIHLFVDSEGAEGRGNQPQLGLGKRPRTSDTQPAPGTIGTSKSGTAFPGPSRLSPAPSITASLAGTSHTYLFSPHRVQRIAEVGQKKPFSQTIRLSSVKRNTAIVYHFRNNTLLRVVKLIVGLFLRKCPHLRTACDEAHPLSRYVLAFGAVKVSP
jgi:hypothetical protein